MSFPPLYGAHGRGPEAVPPDSRQDVETKRLRRLLAEAWSFLIEYARDVPLGRPRIVDGEVTPSTDRFMHLGALIDDCATAAGIEWRAFEDGDVIAEVEDYGQGLRCQAIYESRDLRIQCWGELNHVGKHWAHWERPIRWAQSKDTV